MKRIVLCFDGTWNTPADEALPEGEQVETNVRRFFESVQPVGDDGVQQVVWYNEGVGTGGHDHLVGGIFGAGLERHIVDGYRYLVDTFSEGDEIYIVGFSRGAYTARSLVGMLCNCGLLKPGAGTAKILTAYGMYRTRNDGVDSKTAKLFRLMFSREVRVKFLGVWDTVGRWGFRCQSPGS